MNIFKVPITPLLTTLLTTAMLVVCVASCQEQAADSGVTDEELAAEIGADLMSDIVASSAVDVWKNGVSVKDGVVTLSGTVFEESKRVYIENLVKDQPGIRGVVNNIVVDEEAPALKGLGDELEKHKSGVP
ncbi:MAG TPA: BON domain-containing protein [Thermoanaerobaculia bacterium]|nr:BON domain-containing protein [Thermoanaerobaculia bacterium]